MRHETELRVQVQQGVDSEPQWYPLDIGSGNTLTLDYVSNLLSDVSKITSSRSFTVKMPRTRWNDTVLDLAVVPQHESQRPYRYLPCRVYVDGIDVAGEAYMYLVSADASTYNAVIVFGLMQEYKAWVDAGLGLKNLLDNGESIQWDFQAAYTDGPHSGMPDPWAPIWYGDDAASYLAQNGLSKAMYFGIYNPGFALTWPNVELANVHPFVTVREIWERIITENSLDFRLPNDVKLDMEDLAIVLTKTSGNIPVGVPTIHTTQINNPHVIHRAPWRFFFNLSDSGYFDYFTDTNNIKTANKVLSLGVKPVILNISIVLENYEFQGLSNLIHYVGGRMDRLKLAVYDLMSHTVSYITPSNVGTTDSQLLYSGQIELNGSELPGDSIAMIAIKIEPTNYIEDWRMVDEYLGDISATGSVQYITYEDAVDYPNQFLMVPNLPDIKQIDFVKMVCHLYGLFPCQRGNIVYFVPIEDLEENKPRAYDWSRYLLEDDTDAPHHTDWHMTDLARRNRVSYKIDEKDIVVDEAFLTVDDDTLEREKDFFTIPLAASEGDTINQYNIIDVEYQTNDDPPQTAIKQEAVFTECEHRLMRVVEWYNYDNKTVTRLAFQNLSSAYIIAERYATYQAYVNQPRIITERLRVPLADLRTLDYSVPVFLSKYGRHFAVIDIKWTVTQDTCEAKLLML